MFLIATYFVSRIVDGWVRRLMGFVSEQRMHVFMVFYNRFEYQSLRIYEGIGFRSSGMY